MSVLPDRVFATARHARRVVALGAIVSGQHGAVRHSTLFAACDQGLNIDGFEPDRAPDPDLHQLSRASQPTDRRQRHSEALGDLPNSQKSGRGLAVACICMTKHERISPALTLPAKGQQPLLFGDYLAPPGPPSEWQCDELGEPLWISSFPLAQGAPWAWVWIIPPASAVTQLPAWQQPWLARALQAGPISLPHLYPLVPQQRGEGAAWDRTVALLRTAKTAEERAKIEDELRNSRTPGNPGLCSTAWREIQCAAWLADGLELPPARVADRLGLGGTNERSTKRTAKRHIDAGRQLLNDSGVLPWTLWQNGEVPSTWWQSPEFLLGLNLWWVLIMSQASEIRLHQEVHHRSADAARVHEGQPPRVADGNYEQDVLRRERAQQARRLQHLAATGCIAGADGPVMRSRPSRS